MNNQEAFDKICKHLMTQNEKAWENGSCVLCTPTGLKCAIGCLIPDELYDPSLENLVPAYIGTVERLKPLFDGVDKDLLDHCRCVHDNADLRDWARDLRHVAEQHLLMPPDCIKESSEEPTSAAR